MAYKMMQDLYAHRLLIHLQRDPPDRTVSQRKQPYKNATGIAGNDYRSTLSLPSDLTDH